MIGVKLMKPIASIAVSLVFTASVACAATPAPAPVPPDQVKPALVMLVVVDQLRATLLDRYDDLFTGGFRRLRDQGYSYVNASQAHANTETAVGHATLSTGVYPSRHGIVANAWYEKGDNQWVIVENIDDPTVKIVGFEQGHGYSPVQLKRSGLAEWVTAADRKSIVASVSGKNRGAIQPAAHSRNGYVYWFDPAAGRYVTSTYYRNADPDWVARFNTTTLQAHLADTVWNFLAPASAMPRSNPDTSGIEGNGTSTFFPHRFSVEGNPAAFWSWWVGTPLQDVATLQLARAAVTELKLGSDASPDFLNVSLSATDYVGHGYGPLSREQMDNLLRLDRELGQFFDFLDSTVGK
jgi:predicted AlkP superfamily pyrophosphatase or phosphodiesterase